MLTVKVPRIEKAFISRNLLLSTALDPNFALSKKLEPKLRCQVQLTVKGSSNPMFP